MSSANISSRSAGRVAIPIEIIPSPKGTFSSNVNPPMPTVRANYPSSDFTSSPPRANSRSKSHFPARANPTTVINRSSHREPSAFFSSPSNEDFLSSSLNPKRSNTQPQKNTLRLESDFIHPNKPIPSMRRSVDVLSAWPDYHVPASCQRQGAFPNSHDRSRSPASQRSESPTRPPRPPGTSQPESDFQTSKDPTLQSNDQQVPSTELPPRDPNIVALEKLEHIKQNLADLHEQVDAFSGLTRDDRAYKQLDEHAVKLMLRCDELTDVSADIKEKRKEMIRSVQTVVAKLESKVPINPLMDSNSNENETALVIYDSPINSPTERLEQST